MFIYSRNSFKDNRLFAIFIFDVIESIVIFLMEGEDKKTERTLLYAP